MGAGNDKVAFDAVPTGFKAGLVVPESGGEMASASLVSFPSSMTFFLFSASTFSCVGLITSCAARNTVVSIA